MAYEVVMPYHLHMPSYFLETFTEYPYYRTIWKNKRFSGWFTFFQNYSFLYKKNRIFAPVKTKFDL